MRFDIVLSILSLMVCSAIQAEITIEPVTYVPRISGSHGLLETTGGEIFLSDSYAGSDAVYRINNGYPEVMAGGFDTPAGMGQADNGDIYVCDVNASRLYRFDSSWNQLEWYPVPYPWNIVFDGEDILAASYDGNVYRISGGSTTIFWSDLTDPFGIAIDAERNVYVSEYFIGRIKKRTPDGVISILTEELTQPEGIRIGPDGRLWVADTAEGALFAVSLSGDVEEIDSGAYDFSIAVNLTQVRDNHILLGCAGSNGRVFRLTCLTPAPTNTPTPTNTPAPTNTPTNTPAPTNTPTNTPTPTITPTPALTATGTPECINDGDVNGDGNHTAADAQMAFLIVLGAFTPTYEEACAADCNGDGNITAGDAQQIFLAVLGTGICSDPFK